jgi:hypothetical protein
MKYVIIKNNIISDYLRENCVTKCTIWFDGVTRIFDSITRIFDIITRIFDIITIIFDIRIIFLY